MEPFTNTNQQPISSKKKLGLSLDYRLIIVVLLVIIAGMLAIWRPWSSGQVSNRTITVTGDATLKAQPDEYIFNPTYEFKNADKQAALTALTAKSDTLVTKLKSLGVTDSQIKTNSSGSNNGPIIYDYVVNPDNTTTYTLQLTVTVSSRDVAQKVQDYLTTTTPTGSVSPEANFSTALQKSLQSQARDQATKDARAKADQSAKNLGFKVGAVKSVTDGSGFDGVTTLNAQSTVGGSLGVAQPKLSVQPGENSLSYSVDVVYYIH